MIGSRWAESSGYFAFPGHCQRWKRQCQERCHLQQWGHRSQFPFLRASADLARNILVTVVYKDHMHPRLTFNGKKSLSSFSRSQRTPKIMRYWKQAPSPHLLWVPVPERSFSLPLGGTEEPPALPGLSNTGWKEMGGKKAKPGW